MDAKRYERMKELFLDAVELPREQRRDFLETSCGDDPDMRRQVESLLAYHLEPEPCRREEGDT